MMLAHFVTFQSPGTFVAEASTRPVDSWNVATALRLMKDITERHGAKPYGFFFTTRGREDHELDSKVIKTSPMYYVGGVVRTLEQVIEQNDPEEEILRWNMKANRYDRVWNTTSGWKWSQGLNPEDIVLAEPGE